MSDLAVDCQPGGDGWICSVSMVDDGSRTEHEVAVSREELARYGAGTTEPTALVSESFRFLLEREPKESIMRRFELSVIERYFPEYGRAIGGRLGRA